MRSASLVPMLIKVTGWVLKFHSGELSPWRYRTLLLVSEVRSHWWVCPCMLSVGTLDGLRIVEVLTYRNIDCRGDRCLGMRIL